MADVTADNSASPISHDPVPEDPTALPPHCHVEPWAGHDAFKCELCPHDSVYLAQARDHYRGIHFVPAIGSLDKPTPPVTAAAVTSAAPAGTATTAAAATPKQAQPAS